MADVNTVTGKLADVTLSKVGENKENGSPDQLWKKESEKQKLENELLRKKIQEIEREHERERQEIEKERERERQEMRNELKQELDRLEKKATIALEEMKRNDANDTVTTEGKAKMKMPSLASARAAVEKFRGEREKLATATGKERAEIERRMKNMESEFMLATKMLNYPSVIAQHTDLRGNFMSRLVDMPSSLFCRAFRDDFHVSAELDDEEDVLRRVTQILGVQVRSWPKERDWNKTLSELITVAVDSLSFPCDVKMDNYDVIGKVSTGRPDIAVLMKILNTVILVEESKFSRGFALCQAAVSYVYAGENVLRQPVGSIIMREIFPCLLISSHEEEVLIYGIVTLPSPLPKYPNRQRRIALTPLRSFLLISPCSVIPMLKYLKGMLNILGGMWKAASTRKSQLKDPTQATLAEELRSYVSDLPQVESFQNKDGDEVSLRFITYVRGSVFKAQNDRSKENLIVKFVAASYGEEAHNFCAEHKCAPELLGIHRFERCRMVVMKEIRGQSLDEIDADSLDSSTKRTIARNLKDALAYLHTGGYVHGDFRQPNLMVEEETNKVFIIDFDWADEYPFAFYPSHLNSGISWHPGAERGTRIDQEHDQYFLSKHLAWLGHNEMLEGD